VASGRIGADRFRLRGWGGGDTDVLDDRPRQNPEDLGLSLGMIPGSRGETPSGEMGGGDRDPGGSPSETADVAFSFSSVLTCLEPFPFPSLAPASTGIEFECLSFFVRRLFCFLKVVLCDWVAWVVAARVALSWMEIDDVVLLLSESLLESLTTGGGGSKQPATTSVAVRRL